MTTASTESAVALGIFDGVHIGHRAVLQAATACQADGLEPAAFTFWTASIPAKHGEPMQYLYTDTMKHRLMEKNGIQRILSPLFPALAELDGETFCKDYLQQQLHAKRVFCGADFRFGKGAAWNVEDLKRFGQAMGFAVKIVEAVRQDGEIISSSRIRQLLLDGEIKQAALLLGAPYQLEGVVQRGAQLGRTIDFPTINIPFAEGQLVPRHGVYLSRVYLAEDIVRDGITNIGVKPTVSNAGIPVSETHLLSFDGDLYGTHCRLELLHFLRPEKQFDGLSQLKQAIATDVAAAKEMILRR